MRVIGSKGAVLLALVVAMLIALPASAMAATVLMVGGLAQKTLDDYTMGLALGGEFGPQTPWKRVSVSWPADAAPFWGTMNLADSVAEGTANLIAAIKSTYNSTSGPITVLGTSAGTIVVDEAMRALANDPTAPPKSAVNFVVLADATQRPGFVPGGIWNPFDTLSGYTYVAPPTTPYNLTVVTYEYDGWADFPDRWWNFYAVSNAIVGGFLLHAATWFVDLPTVDGDLSTVDGDMDITTTTNSMNGVTTSYFVHPKTLPLVQLYPSLAPLQDWLKEQIDAGYSRNDQTAGASSAVTASAAIAPNPQSTASTIDPPAGAAANSGEERAQHKALANATVGVAKATRRADRQLANATRAVGNGNGATGRKNVKASTNGGSGGTRGTVASTPGSLGVTGVDGRGRTGGAGGTGRAGGISGNGTPGNQGGTGRPGRSGGGSTHGGGTGGTEGPGSN
jgi:hypothetical protein